MIYLVSPYSHADNAVMHERYLCAMYAAADLLKDRRYVYSPIVHCHEMARGCALPTDFAFWRDYNLHVLSRCDEVYFLQIDGWRESKGSYGEISFWAALQHKPAIVTMRPNDRTKIVFPAYDLLEHFHDSVR